VDPQSRERIYAMIGELKAGGVSILYTTHYMEEAERLCDRIAIIDNGRIIASGTTEELIRKSVGAKQALTIDTTAPIPSDIRERLSRAGATLLGDGEGDRLQASVEDPATQIRQLLELLHAGHVGVRDLTLKSPTLEQVFLQLTGRELRE
jgi:ABC-2 type transport system ATP-binding protein